MDPDPCFLALAPTAEQPQGRYREFVARGISAQRLELLRSAIQRNQLTGSDAFIVEVEQRIGDRVLSRRPGRPNTQKKKDVLG